MEKILGIDVGASGIKGGLVNPETGEMVSERIKYPTPQPSKPKKILKVIKKIVKDHDWKNKPIGIGFPSIIKNGVCHSASNIHKSWIGYNLLHALTENISKEVVLLNDADAAGLAEMEYGQGKDVKAGIIILLTLGTGIGSALFHDGKLLPNTEFGQLHFRDSVTEKYAANSIREINNLSWKDWGKDLNEVIKYFNFIFSPDLFIIGGGVSKKFGQYSNYLSLSEKVVPAQLLNNAGIIGAALAMKKALIARDVQTLAKDMVLSEK